MENNLPKSKCPCCGYVMDAAINPSDEELTPIPGDISMCIKCATLLVFNDDMILEERSEEEIGELPHETRMEINQLRKAIQFVNKGKVTYN